MQPKAEEILAGLSPALAEDTLLALRYLYYVQGRPIVPDKIYDLAEKEFIERPDTDTFMSPIMIPGSDNPEHYPPRIRALAIYLQFIQADKARASKLTA